MPAIGFDPAIGLLTVIGDEGGPTDDVIIVSVTSTKFVEVVINGIEHSSEPTSSTFDPALRGASPTSVRAIHIQGLGGNDRITLGAGFASAYFASDGTGGITLAGGTGDDLITAMDTAATVFGGTGNDTLYGSSSYDTLLGGQGNDQLFGGGGRDWLQGGPGDDYLRGGAEDDRLDGGPGDDNVGGGLGADTVVQIVDADQTLTDLQLTGSGRDSLRSVERAELTGGAGDNLIDASQFSLWSVSYGGVVLDGAGGDDSLIGSLGYDTLWGGDGDDTIDGGAGFDYLRQIADSDQLLTDTQLVGRGTDSFVNIESFFLGGGPGNNLIDASHFTLTKADQYSLSLFGGDGDDTLIGSPGGDWMDGGRGNDLAWGGPGEDFLTSSSGSDTLRGGSGNDHLSDDSPGDALLFGGAGDDYLSVQQGHHWYLPNGFDSLIGGAGLDHFVIDPDEEYCLVDVEEGETVVVEWL